MDSVKLILKLCEENGVRVSRLEKDLGFSNGYIKGLRRGKVPVDRAAKIAEYFNVPISTFTGEEKEEPATNGDGLTEDQKAIIRLLPRLTPEETAALLAQVKETILGQ